MLTHYYHVNQDIHVMIIGIDALAAPVEEHCSFETIETYLLPLKQT